MQKEINPGVGCTQLKSLPEKLDYLPYLMLPNAVYIPIYEFSFLMLYLYISFTIC